MMTGLNMISDVPGVSQLLTAMFSLLLLIIGMNSMIATFLTVKYAILDQFKLLRGHRTKLTFGLCAFCFLLSLPYCASGGYYLFLAMDEAVISNNAILIAFLQLILVGWFFGVEKFLDCVSKMGIQLSSITKWYFHISIKYVCPFTLTTLLVIALVNIFTNPQFLKYQFKEGNGPIDDWENVECNSKEGNCTYVVKEARPLIWLVQIFTLSLLPIMVIWKNWQFRNSSKSIFRPTAQWKPADELASVPF